jgi:hypothetical protein
VMLQYSKTAYPADYLTIFTGRAIEI